MMPPAPNDSAVDDAAGQAERDAERRNADRAVITLRVEYKKLNTFFADYTNNISKGGTFIRTSHALPLHTEFVFELTLPTSAEKIPLRGKVMWIVTDAEADLAADKPAGMGIRFVFAGDAERVSLHDLVERLMEESLGAAISTRLLASKPGPP